MSLMTRDEHLAWAKKRALEYVDHGGPVNAVSLMLSDLSKHPELEKVNEHMKMFGIMFATQSTTEARRFIEGFR